MKTKLNTDSGLFNAAKQSRIKRMNNIVDSFKLNQDFPLMKAIQISAPLFQELSALVNLYLYSCIARYNRNEIFIFCDDVLDKYSVHVQALPNITPNGLILPKAEVFLEYNQVHQAVAKIFIELGLDRYLSAVHAPINIRLVSGLPNPALENRPRSATKIHSDMWAGEPADAIMVFIPLFGDTDNVGVKFYEPEQFPRELIRPLDDFNEGSHVAKKSIEYKGADFSKGQLILTDPFLLHQTNKNKSGLRLSIDFRFIAKEKVEMDDLMESTRIDSYLTMEEWCDFGKGRLLTTKSRLEKFTGKDVVNDRYASNYEIKRLS